LRGQSDCSIRGTIGPVATALDDFEEEAFRERPRHQMKVLTIGVTIVEDAELL